MRDEYEEEVPDVHANTTTSSSGAGKVRSAQRAIEPLQI
jgi:hypothetical protein